MRRHEVELPINYFDLAERILTKRFGEAPTRLDVLRFCRELMNNALDREAMLTLGIDLDDYSGVWWRLYGIWLRLRLWKYKGTTADERAIEDNLELYGVEKIVEAMENYARIVLGEEYYEPERMDFDEFMVRGIEAFTNDSNPREKYRRVTAIDLAKQLRLAKYKTRVRVNGNKLRKINLWLQKKLDSMPQK